MHLNLKFAYFSQVQSTTEAKINVQGNGKNAQKGLVIA